MLNSWGNEMHSDVGALLVEGGIISEEQLQHALTTVVQYGGSLIANLIRLGYVETGELAAFLSSKLKLPMAEKTQFENLPAFITRLVPNDTVLAHRLIPIMLHQGVLHVAMADPTDRAAREEIAFATGYKVSPVVARQTLIEEAMARYYGIPPEDQTLPPEAFSPTTGPQGTDEAVQSDQDEPQEDKAKQETEQTTPTAFSRTLETFAVEAEEGEKEEEKEGEEEGEEEPPPAEDDAAPPEEQPAEEAVSVESREAGLEQARGRLEVVEKAEDELEELFFGLGGEDRGIVHLTRKKSEEATPRSGTITDAIRSQAGVRPPTGDNPPGSVLENILSQARAESQSRRIEKEVDSVIEGHMRAEELPGDDKALDSLEISVEMPEEPAFEPLTDSEEARILIGEAGDRDEVARILVRFALAFMPRIALFIVKKDIMVGWMGGGQGVTNRQIRGIMIPLNSPSVFRTVRETATDYFGSLPKTTVNDVFIAALGDVRPRQILLVPVTVRHKPICILYGDCGEAPGFSKDLSPVHLLLTDVSQAFERMILEAKMSRRAGK